MLRTSDPPMTVTIPTLAVAFVMQSDPRRTLAIGCGADGIGFRASLEPFSECHTRVTRYARCVKVEPKLWRHFAPACCSHADAVVRVGSSIALAIHPTALALHQPDADAEAPLAAAYLREPARLDDGQTHRLRLRYVSASEPQLSIFVDDDEQPLFVAPGEPRAGNRT